ncbi:opine dehydrogenase [Dethiosulfatibacter aminovorans DSM 17477]|uniref:Opine dehydrogenase n=1 Tax=Dethiosulfatibacter aminovorans DSM 17477 TaxID=1121476 RepID=A0A1M6GRX7_9FIRM|nr:NAD/NADP octopine/nopaline dehydrogenase family protein [Dethiosulfatibacter aminovorans]SHJ12678.1 opine dehydrogenase [Dethiosulfatibacter aminovorans DSM 17477]
MDKMKIAVLGGGNSGYALSAYLTHLGHCVKLYKRSFKRDKTEYEYEMNASGIFDFSCSIHMVTGNLDYALKGVQIAFLCIPAYCQEMFFDDLLNSLKKIDYENVYTVLMPDNYGCILLEDMIMKRGMGGYNRVLSLGSSLFASRAIDDRNVDFKGIKSEILVSSIYPEVVNDGVSIMNRIIDVFVKGRNIFEVNLSNMNPVVHTAVTVMNAARLENTKGEFDFYREGITPSVARVIEKVDMERMEIAKALGIETETLMDYIEHVYGFRKSGLYETLSESFVHTRANGPASLESRYVTEDIPYGLMPMAAMGRYLKIKTEAIDSLIVLGTIASGKVFDGEICSRINNYIVRNQFTF